MAPNVESATPAETSNNGKTTTPKASVTFRLEGNASSSSTERVRSLLTAAVTGDSETLRQLLDHPITQKKSFWLQACHPLTGSSLLHLAVIFGNTRAVETLLRQPECPILFRDYEGRSALHYAAALSGIHNDPTLYFVLIEAGASESTLDYEAFSPVDVRQDPLLIDMNSIRLANRYPVALQDDGGSLLAMMSEEALESMVLDGQYDAFAEMAVLPEHSTLHQRLLDLQTRVDGVWQAIYDGDMRTLKHLVCDQRMGLCRDGLSRTPLHVAYLVGRIDIVDYLLYVCPQAANAKDREDRLPVEYSLLSESDEEAKNRQHIRRKRLKQSRLSARRLNKSRMRIPVMGEYDEDADTEIRVLGIDTSDRSYFTVLEELQIEGKAEQIWRTVKKNVANEKLVRFVNDFRNLQMRLNSAIEAIEKNDERRLRQLVDENLVGARDTRGMRLLHIAVLRERHEIVEFLATDFSAFIDLPDAQGRTPLHYAAVQPNAIYDTLVELGADPNINDLEGNSASFYRENPDRMSRPLSAPSPFNFFHSSSEDDWCDPDAPREEEIDVWVNSGEVGRLEQLVLDGRAHLLADRQSLNAQSREFLRSLPQYQSKIEAIHKAVEDGDVRRVKSLIDRPQLATARDSYGMTPLHKALLHGQTNTVRFLLAKYPNAVNAADHAGRTALHYAAADPNGEHMIKVLQKSGGDAFIEDKHGHTPFYYRTHGQRLNVRTLKDNAVMSQLISGQLSRPLLQDLEEDIYDWIHTGNVGKLEELVLTGYADLLLGRNHEVEDSDSIGFLEVLPQYQAKIAAIHKAVETGNLRAVKLLTDRKKLALCRDSRGLSPLHKSIVFEKTDIAKYLIRNYPQSVNAMDQKKRTPLHYAAALKDGGYLYKVMRRSGADPNVYDCHGRPAKYYLKHPGEIDLAAMRLDTKAALKQVLHNRVAPSYLESSIQQWLRDGQIAKLEQLVLSGCGDLLQNRSSANSDTSLFLNQLPDYLENIDGIHRAIREGDLELVKELMTTKKLAIARDRFGCTPLHAAVVHEHTDIVRFIAGHFPSVLNAPDYNKRTAMHYAAAARDGGHYLKILGKAGADPMAVDNEGRTPDYYRRNAVIDLKMIKDREDDFELLNEELLEDGPLIDSPASPDSASIDTEHVDSARVYEDEDEFDRHRFERMVHTRVDLPTSENGIYLARTVAPVLTKALAEVLLRRPADPIGFISDWLLKYTNEMPKRNV
ncbi:unnamed protein product, partial [Mesorhabditis belari]|uniref:Uncharacterized protein n=1 Tax=Mesorhabditis belari TaxID=2138241 RepID=A0AAF3E9P1_9BILA